MRSLSWLATCAALLAVGCGRDLAGPASFDDPSEPGEPWAVQPVDACRPPETPPGTLTWSNSVPDIDSLCATLWVTQGEDDQILTVWYGDDHEESGWFLRLFIPEDAQLVDDHGEPVPEGTRVPVSVAIHPERLAVRFSPHGARFAGRPAVLKVSYQGADLGTGNESELKILYQPDDGAEWTEEPTELDQTRRTICVKLEHFSNYAVAW